MPDDILYNTDMNMDRRAKGFECEGLVSDFLRKEGYTVLERNYRCPMGEIDVLSLSPEGVLCVTEVKSLSGRWASDDVRYMVDGRKKIRLKKTLEHYLANGHEVKFKAIRFDVATVTDAHVTYYSGEY